VGLFSGQGGPDGLFFQAADQRAQIVSPETIAETFGAAGASVQLVADRSERPQGGDRGSLGLRDSIEDDAARLRHL
jgi:hypothetical protein